MNRRNLSCMGRRLSLAGIAAVLLSTGACSKMEASAPPESSRAKRNFGGLGVGGGGAAMEADAAPAAAMRGAMAPSEDASGNLEMKKSTIGLASIALEGKLEEGEAAPAARTRSWFPETFLFEPRLVTDASGIGSIEVRVPDRLTTWRVLALAHSRDGALGGGVGSFVGTLPVYVDPVLPAFLTVGDEVELPVQVVNTSASPVSGRLSLEVEGARVLRGSGPLQIGAESSQLAMVRLAAERPGTLVFRAGFGDRDAVERTVPVEATGRPLVEERSGTLAAPRDVEVKLPEDTIPYSTRVRLTVFPGAIAVLRSELAAVVSRGDVASDGYALLLAGRAPELLKNLGAEVDAEALRRIALVATQRVLRHARAPDPAMSTLLAEAALAHPDNAVLSRLGERLSGQLAASQRPDGTFQGATGWTLQRLLVATADGLRALSTAQATDAGKRRATGARIRANGAFERYVERVTDPYTAAAILASGGVEGSLAETLRARVREAVEVRDGGAKVLAVPKGAVRADGNVPGELEATALAVLALKGDSASAALLPDLGATLLAGYRPGRGFGDGRASLIALTAVLELFREPMPSRVKVQLFAGDISLVEGVLEGERLRQVLALGASMPEARGLVKFRVVAQPPVPGLGYSIVVDHHVPWSSVTNPEGIELSVDVSSSARVGETVDVTVRAIAPAQLPLRMRHALPAGVQPDTKSLDALVAAGTITSYETEDGAVELNTGSRRPGEPFVAKYRVVPTLAGQVRGGASTLSVGYPPQTTYLPPAVWTVR